MPAKNLDLHGNTPDQSPVALLLIDVINDLEWEGGEQMLEQVLTMAKHIAALARRAREAGIPIVYVNDNYGKWQSDFRQVVDHCLTDGVRGQPLAELLHPADDDYFVLKPKHSGFYSTTLDTLLDYLGAKTLILTGIAANNCVLFTASDAFMRDFNLVVPPDCVASADAETNRVAVEQMRTVLHADTTASAELDLEALKREYAPA